MPDLEVTVGGDISSFLSKIDAAKAKVNQLTESQEQLKVVINDINKSIAINERELTKASVSLQKLNTTTTAGKSAATALRTEIGQLALNSKTLATNLTTAKTQLAATSVQLKTASIDLKSAETGTGGLAKGVTKAYSGLRTLANIIPGIGIGGLVGLIAGPLVDAFEDWYKVLTKTTNTSKLLRDVEDEAVKGYGKEVGELKVLRGAIEDTHLPMATRLQAIKNIREEYPEYFKGLTNEQLLTGKVAFAYDLAAAAIYRKAKAQAASSQIEKNAARDLEIIQKGLRDAEDSNKRLAEIQKDAANTKSTPGSSVNSAAILVQAQTDELRKGFKEREKLRHEERVNLQKDNDFLIGIANQGAQSLIKIDKEKTEKTRVGKGADPFSIELKALENNYKNAQAIAEGSRLLELSATHDFLEKKKALLEKYGKLEGENNLAIAKNNNEILKDELKFRQSQLIALSTAPTLSATDPITSNTRITPSPALQKIFDAYDKLLKKQELIKESLNTVLGPAFEDFFDTILTGGKGAFQSFGQAINDVIRKLIVAVAKSFALGLIFSAITGKTFNVGNALAGAFGQGHAAGGFITGPGSSTSDSIPARLSAGEYVINADTVKKFGVPFFNMINKGQSTPPNFANGGSVTGAIGGGQNLVVEVVGRLRGNDIYISNQRAAATIRRNG